MYGPRPEKAIDPSELGRFEQLGWIGQLKLNGTYTIYDNNVYTRHQEKHKLWDPVSSKAMVELWKLKDTTICAELLHKKVSGGHQDTLYVHDLLTHRGEDLVGSTYRERYKLLMNLFELKDNGDLGHLVVNKNLWVSRWLTQGFKSVFDSITDPEVEGLVLKNPGAKLAFCGKAGNNGFWQIKCRKPHKNYSF
jgi:hypothetical protein